MVINNLPTEGGGLDDDDLAVLNRDTEESLDQKIYRKPTQIETLVDDTKCVIAETTRPWYNKGVTVPMQRLGFATARVYVDGYIYEFNGTSSVLNIYRHTMNGDDLTISSTTFTGTVTTAFAHNDTIYVQVHDTLYKWVGREAMNFDFVTVKSGLWSAYERTSFVIGDYAYMIGFRYSTSPSTSSPTNYKINLTDGTVSTITFGPSSLKNCCTHVFVDGDTIYFIDYTSVLYSMKTADFTASTTITPTVLINDPNDLLSNYYSHTIIKIGGYLYVTIAYNLTYSYPKLFYCDFTSNVYRVVYTIGSSNSYYPLQINDLYAIYLEDGKPIVSAQKRKYYYSSSSWSYSTVNVAMELFLYKDNPKAIGYRLYTDDVPFMDNFYSFLHDGELYTVRFGTSATYSSLYNWALIKHNPDADRQFDIVYCYTRDNEEAGATISTVISYHILFHYYNGRLYVVDYENDNDSTTASDYRLSYIDLSTGEFVTLFDRLTCKLEDGSEVTAFITTMFEMNGNLYGAFISGYEINICQITDTSVVRVASCTPSTSKTPKFDSGTSGVWQKARNIKGKIYIYYTTGDSSDGLSTSVVFDGETLTKSKLSIGTRYAKECMFDRPGKSFGAICYDNVTYFDVDHETDVITTVMYSASSHKFLTPLYFEHYHSMVNNVLEHDGKLYASGICAFVHIPLHDVSKTTSMYLPAKTQIVTDKRYVKPVLNLKEVDNGYEVLETGLIKLGEVGCSEVRALKTII